MGTQHLAHFRITGEGPAGFIGEVPADTRFVETEVKCIDEAVPRLGRGDSHDGGVLLE